MTKNKKFKRRQKGGNQMSENLGSQQKTMTAGSNRPTWGKYNHNIFLWVIFNYVCCSSRNWSSFN